MSPAAVLTDAGYPRLKNHLIEASGLAYYDDKDETLARRIAPRLAALGMRNCTAYLEALRGAGQGRQELDALIAALTIGETYFFRHSEQFETMRRVVLPDILDRNQGSRRLRVWSAGCATGAETYTLAALLREFDGRTQGWDIALLGSDINRQFLARAAEGCFQDWAFRGVPAGFRERYFTRTGKCWQISSELRRGVRFEYHNLVEDSVPALNPRTGSFDLIVCRNVLIYFQAAVIRRVVARLREALAEGGWLVVGHAESGHDAFADFRVVRQYGTPLYQRALSTTVSPDGGEKFAVPPASPASWQAAAWQTDAWTAPQAASPDPESGSDTGRDTGSENTSQSGNEPCAGLLDGPAGAPPVSAGAGIEAVRRLADGGDWQQAAEHCRRLLAEDSLDPLAYFYSALIHEQSGARAQARLALRRALYLDRNFVVAHYHLGLLHQKEKDTAEAARSFENVIALLARRGGGETLALADGITVGELRALTRAHLAALQIHA